MSIKDRLAKKTEDLLKPAAGAASGVPAGGAAPSAGAGDPRIPRTGPGQMLAFRSHMQESNQKVQQLEERLKGYEGSLPVRRIDPQQIRPSKWANRHDTSFLTAEFAALKKEIESAGGNVQPIRVRPAQGRDGSSYEIVYGHRRHQACLQLGIPVSAVVESLDDRALFATMDRENRARADLSAYEQGEMYRRALDDGLFPSLRSLAAELGVDAGNVSKAISIARLPGEVLAAFDSPTQIQYRWGQELHVALQHDPEAVIERAKSIRRGVKKLAGSEVLDRLVGRVKATKPVVIELKQKGRVVGRLQRKADGGVQLTLNAGVLDEEAYQDLQTAVEQLLDMA